MKKFRHISISLVILSFFIGIILIGLPKERVVYVGNDNSKDDVIEKKNAEIEILKQGAEMLRPTKGVTPKTKDSLSVLPESALTTSSAEEDPSDIRTNTIAQKTESTPKPDPPEINLRSIVGIVCETIDRFGNEGLVRGSGVIVSSNGYIFTNRHVVDPSYSNAVSGEDQSGAVLKNGTCKIYFLADERFINSTPVPQYYFIDIDGGPGNYDFLAEPVLTAKLSDGLSIDELLYFDFALLKFKEWNVPKYSFGRSVLSLSWSDVFWDDVPLQESVIMPGFAYQEEGVGSFDKLRLTIITGTIEEKVLGDQNFKDLSLYLKIKNTADIAGGRSGAPIFWRGRVVGLVTTRAPSPSYQIAMQSVYKFLVEAGYNPAR
ncbi:MAG: serine protease [Patescibacteria group bacterium]|mgnify:CR=1 FL=1